MCKGERILIVRILDGNQLFSMISEETTFQLIWMLTVIVAGICVCAGGMRKIAPVFVLVGYIVVGCTLIFIVAAFANLGNFGRKVP